VNFWPNMELEEYINLEQRVSGRMVLLDVSATGEENIIEQQSGNQMNDLEYRRNQLLKLQETVIDLEDLSSGVAITDLTLTDFRIDLAEYNREHPAKLEGMPLGCFAVTTSIDADIAPGVLFCLRAAGNAADKVIDPSYPLAPHYLVHVVMTARCSCLTRKPNASWTDSSGSVWGVTFQMPRPVPVLIGPPDMVKTCAKRKSSWQPLCLLSLVSQKSVRWRACSRRVAHTP